jgi:hypothetical protein
MNPNETTSVDGIMQHGGRIGAGTMENEVKAGMVYHTIVGRPAALQQNISRNTPLHSGILFVTITPGQALEQVNPFPPNMPL